ncbi:glycosyltransferase family protein [Virgibacillus dokdonensis]|uniref:Glycosyltransferase n=1 Tax=Virgibacillus dokdonensis TaxID=302167 RepID=A0ABU7VHZ6_9BACI
MGVKTKSIEKSYADVISNDFFSKKNWNFKKKDLELYDEGNKLIIESKKEKVSYLTLYEKNTNFRKAPKNEKKIIITKDTLIRVSGNCSKNIKVTIYIIEYDEKNKIKSNRIFMNRESEIYIHPETKTLRLAIRIEGKGEVCITSFKLNQDFISKQKANYKQHLKGKEIRNIKMACIFDEFSLESFGDEVSLTTFTPENWKRILSQDKPDLLMVESAWRGNFGSWEYQVGKYNNNNQNRHLKELVSWCNRHRIPTVFWNKEDPIHFQKFIEAASLFDYIFTTDANSIYKYKEYIGHERVFSLQFAANPKEHNPTSLMNSKKNKISFAGSYYANRHPDRRKDMDEMLEVAKKFGLDIFDRNYERNQTGNSHFMFPKYLQENIVGTLKYNQINKAYKDYRLILNVNSVKDSPTMFSRRVFEGLACGTPIISSFSTGIKKTFNQIVVMSENHKVLEDRINELISDNKQYRQLALKGLREVYRHHTYSHRVQYILDKLRIKYRTTDRSVSLLFLINNIEQLQMAIDIVNNQSYKNVKVVFLVSLFEGYSEVINKYNNKRFSAYIRDYAFKYNDVTEMVETNYLTIMDIKNGYGKYYIEDLIHATKYSEADIIGKKSTFKGNYEYGGYEYQFVESVLPTTCLYKVNFLKKVSLKDLLYNEEKIIEKLFKECGAKIYSADQFNIDINAK